MTLEFRIPGPPVPKARARVVNGRAFTPEKTRAYERLVSLVATSATMSHPVKWTTGDRYLVEMWVTPKDARRFDLDNVAKAVLDGCNGVLWDDDSQVDELRIVRRRPDKSNPGVLVDVLKRPRE